MNSLFNLQGIRTGNRRVLNAFCARLEARKLCEFGAHFVGFGRFVHGVACRTPAHTQLPASVTRNLLFQVSFTYTLHSPLPSRYAQYGWHLIWPRCSWRAAPELT